MPLQRIYIEHQEPLLNLKPNSWYFGWCSLRTEVHIVIIRTHTWNSKGIGNLQPFSSKGTLRTMELLHFFNSFGYILTLLLYTSTNSRPFLNGFWISWITFCAYISKLTSINIKWHSMALKNGITYKTYLRFIRDLIYWQLKICRILSISENIL